MAGSSLRRSTAPSSRRHHACTVLLAAALVAGGCNGPSEVGGDDVARIIDGDAVDIAVGESWSPAQAGDTVPDGARVRTGDGEPVRLALRSGEVRLAPGAAAVVADDDVELLRGEALVASSGDLIARWDDVVAGGEGVYRLELGIAPRLGVYRGGVDLERSTERRRVPALREITLSTRRLPASQAPLGYRSEDPWDRIFLADAIAFDAEARRLTEGLASEYGTDPRPAEFYEPFAPASGETLPIIARAVGAAGNPEVIGPPADALLALFVAESAAEQDTPQALMAAAERVRQLRSADARWGLIAVDLGVTTRELSDAIDEGRARYLAAQQTASAPAGPQPVEPAPEPGGAPHGNGVAPPGQSPPAPPPGPQSPRQSQPSSPPPAGSEQAPSEPMPDPRGGLGQQPRKGVVEAVVDTLLGG